MKVVGSSWWADETYIRARPEKGCLYRAVDTQVKAVEPLFGIERGIGPQRRLWRASSWRMVFASVSSILVRIGGIAGR